MATRTLLENCRAGRLAALASFPLHSNPRLNYDRNAVATLEGRRSFVPKQERILLNAILAITPYQDKVTRHA